MCRHSGCVGQNCINALGLMPTSDFILQTYSVNHNKCLFIISADLDSDSHTVYVLVLCMCVCVCLFRYVCKHM